MRGLVKVTEKTGQSVIQVAAIVLGLGVTGLITGHVLGTFVAAVLGFYTVDIRLERPAKKHFKSLISYARYSWLGGVRSKAFNWVDILVLGFFVTSDKIGIYSVAWNVAGFLFIFASAMSETLFPEMSKLSTLSETAAVRDLVEKALGYTGLILIPGLIGGIVVGDGVLKIYGTEFTRGGIILVFLILTYLIYGYSNQLLTALNAIDRPELAFRVNLILVLSNLTLNTVLVYLFGWTGAAIATATASTLSLLVGYHYLSHLLSFSIPTSLIAKQLFAALCMGGVVYVGQRIEAILSLTESNFLTVLVLVSLGAATYFALMLVISQQFRETVRGNVPQRYQRFI